MITPIDLADTAIKIGLGALISGLAGYLVAQVHYRKEVNKARTDRRIQLLESIAEDVERVTQAALKQWAFMLNWISFNPPGVSLDADLQAEFSGIRSELASATNRLTSAEAKLLLLGEMKSQKLLREYGESVKAYRDVALIKINRTLTVESLNDMRKELLEKRLLLFSELSTVYGRSFVE